MEEASNVSIEHDDLELIQDVIILRLIKDKTTYTAGLFYLHFLLSDIPEKFWMGCFEQVQLKLYNSSSVFIIKDQQCMLTVTEENAQKYIDELKKVINEANKLFQRQIFEVEMERRQFLEEQKRIELKIEKLHDSLII